MKNNSVDYYIDHEYDENYFIFDVEQDYIKETGKMPYKKGDTQLSKEFITWLEKRWIKERAELEKEVKNELH